MRIRKSKTTGLQTKKGPGGTIVSVHQDNSFSIGVYFIILLLDVILRFSNCLQPTQWGQHF